MTEIPYGRLHGVESALGGRPAIQAALEDSGRSLIAGMPVVRKFPFAFDTPGLLTGAALYTPTVGDLLLDAWVEIDTAWNGTTPLFDVGRFLDGYVIGWWGSLIEPLDMTNADRTENVLDYGVLTQGSGSASSALALLSVEGLIGAGPGNVITRAVPAKFVTDDPVKIIVTQTGDTHGADPGSTQGAAILYLITARPV